MGRQQGERWGHVVGGLGVVVAMSACFLAWSKRSREWIPFLALGLTGISFFPQRAEVMRGREQQRAEVDRQLSLLHAASSALLDTTQARDSAVLRVYPDSGDPLPTSAEGRRLWVDRHVMGDCARRVLAAEARYGDPPAAWGTARYGANASAHPEVAVFWAKASAEEAELWRTMPGYTETRYRMWGGQAGMWDAEIDAMLVDVRQVVRGAYQRAALGKAVADAALDYHRFLVSVDSRVRYDARRGVVLFERQADLDRAGRLEERMRRAARAYDEHRAQARARLRANLRARPHEESR